MQDKLCACTYSVCPGYTRIQCLPFINENSLLDCVHNCLFVASCVNGPASMTPNLSLLYIMIRTKVCVHEHLQGFQP